MKNQYVYLSLIRSATVRWAAAVLDVPFFGFGSFAVRVLDFSYLYDYTA